MVPSRFSLLKGALLSLPIAAWLGICGAAQTQSAARPLITRPVDESSLVALRGNVHPLARREFDRGRAPVSLGAQRMLLLLKRTPRQQMMLEQYLASLEDKNFPNFHHFLTPEQFGQQYGPAPEDVAQVVSWLNGQGFAVSKVAKSHMAIEFSGSVNQVERAFHTEIHRFGGPRAGARRKRDEPDDPVGACAGCRGSLSAERFPSPSAGGPRTKRTMECGERSGLPRNSR